MEFCGIFARKGWVHCFFLGQNFALWQQKVKSSAKCNKGLLFRGKKKAQKLPYFEQKNSEIIIYFYNEFMEVTRTKQDSKKKLFSYLTSSQIWLIPLVDNHQSTYLTIFFKFQNLKLFFKII